MNLLLLLLFDINIFVKKNILNKNIILLIWAKSLRQSKSSEKG